MTLRVDEVLLANGERSEYGVVERSRFVLIIAERGDELLLVRQYRYPIEQWTWELPQGAWEPNESAEEAARRELLEETGYVAAEMRLLGTLHEAAGFATQRFQVLLASVSHRSEARPEASEAGIGERWVHASRLEEMILSGAFQDAPSLAALSLHVLRRHAGRRLLGSAPAGGAR